MGSIDNGETTRSDGVGSVSVRSTGAGEFTAPARTSARKRATASARSAGTITSTIGIVAGRGLTRTRCTDGVGGACGGGFGEGGGGIGARSVRVVLGTRVSIWVSGGAGLNETAIRIAAVAPARLHQSMRSERLDASSNRACTPRANVSDASTFTARRISSSSPSISRRCVSSRALHASQAARCAARPGEISAPQA
jgi:hypothetical protein